jgi:signal peptidase
MWNVLRWVGSRPLLGVLALALFVVLVPRVTGERSTSAASESVSPTSEGGGLWNVLRWVGSCLLLGVLALALFIVLVPRLVGVQFVTVLSDSMSPTFERGAVLMVRPVDPASIQVGDVIVFREAYDPDSTVAHRVTAVTGNGSSVSFETKGDANEAPDLDPVLAADVVGKVQFHVPLLGHVARHLRTPLIFLLVIGIPGGLIISQELWNIARVLRRERSTSAEVAAGTESA